MADVTVPPACFGTPPNPTAVASAQGVLDAVVNGRTGMGMASNIAIADKGQGPLPNQVFDTLKCTHDQYQAAGDRRTNDIRTAANMYTMLSRSARPGF